MPEGARRREITERVSEIGRVWEVDQLSAWQVLNEVKSRVRAKLLTGARHANERAKLLTGARYVILGENLRTLNEFTRLSSRTPRRSSDRSNGGPVKETARDETLRNLDGFSYSDRGL